MGLLAARNQSILAVTTIVLVLFSLWQLWGPVLKKHPALVELRAWLIGFALAFWLAMLAVAR